MLAEFLRSVSHNYDISFRNDPERKWLIARVTKGSLCKELIFKYDHLTDEQYIIDALQKAMMSINIALNP